MNTITVNTSEYSKVEITGNSVLFLELMGSRWVELGPAEIYSDELITEYFGIIPEIEA